jgi:hypothetical protein
MNMERAKHEEMKEAAWRRPLKPTEEAELQAFLAAHPDARNAWAEEAALSRLLFQSSAPPVSSNFTARLLQAVRERPAPRPIWRQWLSPGQWLPEGWVSRLAMCSLMLFLGLFSFREYQVAHRAKMAHEMVDVSRLASLPPMGWLKDFDTINRLNQVKGPDDDLLAALK